MEQDTEALASKVFLILFVFHQPFQKIKTWCWWETKSSSPTVFINCLEPELYEKSNWKWVKTINRMIDVLAPICMLFQVVDRLGYGLCIHKCAFALTFLPGILSASSSVTLEPTFSHKKKKSSSWECCTRILHTGHPAFPNHQQIGNIDGNISSRFSHQENGPGLDKELNSAATSCALKTPSRPNAEGFSTLQVFTLPPLKL